jgi:hypothetical protein
MEKCGEVGTDVSEGLEPDGVDEEFGEKGCIAEKSWFIAVLEAIAEDEVAKAVGETLGEVGKGTGERCWRIAGGFTAEIVEQVKIFVKVLPRDFIGNVDFGRIAFRDIIEIIIEIAFVRTQLFIFLMVRVRIPRSILIIIIIIIIVTVMGSTVTCIGTIIIATRFVGIITHGRGSTWLRCKLSFAMSCTCLINCIT